MSQPAAAPPIRRRMMRLSLAIFGSIASKLRWCFDLIYGGIPAEFTSAFDMEESIKRLSAVTREFPILNRQVARGEVSKYFVCLSRPYFLFAVDFRGGLEPHFKGEFSEVDGRTRLSGKFTLGTFAKIFSTVWFGFFAFWTSIAIKSLIAGDTRTWWSPLAGVGFFVVGVAHVWFGKWCARGDIPWLSNLIQDALSGTPPSTRPQTQAPRPPIDIAGAAAE